MRAIRRFTVRPVLPTALSALGELAGNLRWAWHEPTRRLFERVDPELWRRGGADPTALLGAVSPERLAELAGDRGFVEDAWRLREVEHPTVAQLRELQPDDLSGPEPEELP